MDSRLAAQFGQRPTFGGEGFTVQRTGQPTRATRHIGEAVYQSFSFPTAITAAKSGLLEIPPASLPAQVQVPAQVPGGMQDLFGGIFNFNFTETREVEIRTEPVTLEIRPLPTDGQPPYFQGAIGDFRLAVEASPKKAEPGDPITLKVTISGRGNFEAMGPPVLEEIEGWRVYDPSESFQASPSDPIGYLGQKTFEFTLVAKEDQRKTPSVKFSFFNPETARYQTLEGPPMAVEARGSSAQVAATPAPPKNPAPGAPRPTPVSGDHQAELSLDFTAGSFRPAAWAPGFLGVGAALGLLWLAVAGVLLVRRQATSASAVRRAHLRALRGELRQLAASSSLSDAQFLDRAARFARDRLEGRLLEEVGSEVAQQIEEIFDREAEAKFSTRGASHLGAEGRSRILEALRKLDRALPILFAIMGLMFFCGTAGASPLEQAMQSYLQGDFERAARDFNTALETQPPSAGLEYNLGMALKRAGQPGPAALHFLRAMALNPRMVDARIALSDLERSQGIVFRAPSWQERLAEWIPLSALLFAGFGIFWVGAFGLLFLWRGFSVFTLLSSAVAMVAGACLFLVAYFSDPRFAWRGEAVALSTTQVLSAPAERSDTVASLAPGARAKMVKTFGDWVALRLKDGRQGWAKASSVVPVLP